MVTHLGSFNTLWEELWLVLIRVAEESSTTTACATESTNAFRDLVERHRSALQRLCDYRERDPERRRDLWQDILMALWKSRESFRGASSERTWVLRIAHNVAATHVVRAVKAKEAAMIHPDTTSMSESSVHGRIELRELLERLRGMDVAAQQLVLLYLEGLSTDEIAEAMGIRPTNVTTRLSRIRRALTQDEEGR
jgi:RNA polymerase sigma-70 factor (ECF subfamily)